MKRRTLTGMLAGVLLAYSAATTFAKPGEKYNFRKGESAKEIVKEDYQQTPEFYEGFDRFSMARYINQVDTEMRKAIATGKTNFVMPETSDFIETKKSNEKDLDDIINKPQRTIILNLDSKISEDCYETMRECFERKGYKINHLRERKIPENINLEGDIFIRIGLENRSNDLILYGKNNKTLGIKMEKEINKRTKTKGVLLEAKMDVLDLPVPSLAFRLNGGELEKYSKKYAEAIVEGIDEYYEKVEK